MAYALTARAKNAVAQTQVEPNIILLIDGIDLAFGAQVIEALAKYGENDIEYGQPGLVYGGLTKTVNSRDFISLSGTTDNITQQLEPDKGAASSTQTVKVRLIDFNEEVTRIITPGEVVDDVLYRDCQLFLGMKGTAFPEDYIELFNGKVQQVQIQSGAVELTIAHPEDLKRGEIFTRAESKVTVLANFFSLPLQDLYFRQRADVLGIVEIQYINVFLQGQNALVNVSGNLIQVTMESGVTTAASIKKRIENNEDANQLVTISVIGTASDTQTATAILQFQVSDEISLESVEDFFDPVAPIFRTFVKINDELIEYTSRDIPTNKLLGCTRAQLNTVGVTHEIGDDASSFYMFGDGTQTNGNAIDLALWAMLSGAEDDYYTTAVPATDFVDFGPGPDFVNAILFKGKRLNALYGIVTGDFISLSGDPNPANNFVDRVVTNIVSLDVGDYVVVSGAPLVVSVDSPALASFRSQYAILPDGVGMHPKQIDIEQFRRIKTLFSSGIANYRLYLKDTVQSKALINEMLFLPSALYSIPRKGRVSVGYTSPPLYEQNTQILTLDNVKSPSKLQLDRGINKNFYNAVVYKYDEDSIEDKKLSGRITLSNDSTNRIKSPNKALTIDAGGLRPSAATTQLIERNSARFLARYEFAAESAKVGVPFKTGWGVEVGDAIIFGDDALQISDTTQGNRNFKPRIFEVINKEMNWKTGNISLTIVDTNFNQGLRYGVWSPSSKVGTGSTTARVRLVDSFGTTAPLIERDKWAAYIGKTIVVRSPDWSSQYVTRLLSFDNVDPNAMNVFPLLGAVPAANWIVQLANYNDLPNADDVQKLIHLWWTPTLTVVTGVSSTEFTVSPSDAALVFVGAPIRVHDTNYTNDSGEKPRKVTGLTGVNITCDDLGFTPVAGQRVNFVGFIQDKGSAYAWL